MGCGCAKSTPPTTDCKVDVVAKHGAQPLSASSAVTTAVFVQRQQQLDEVDIPCNDSTPPIRTTASLSQNGISSPVVAHTTSFSSLRRRASFPSRGVLPPLSAQGRGEDDVSASVTSLRTAASSNALDGKNDLPNTRIICRPQIVIPNRSCTASELSSVSQAGGLALDKTHAYSLCSFEAVDAHPQAFVFGAGAVESQPHRQILLENSLSRTSSAAATVGVGNPLNPQRPGTVHTTVSSSGQHDDHVMVVHVPTFCARAQFSLLEEQPSDCSSVPDIYAMSRNIED